MDGAADQRSAGSRGVPGRRGLPPFRGRSAALTRSSPLPPPPFAARGRAEGRNGRGEVDPWSPPRREGGGGDGGAAAGRNAVAVAADMARDAAEGFPGLFVEREGRENGGGVGEFGRLAPPAAPPPPKRRAVSATLLDSGGGGEMGLHLEIQPAVVGLGASEEVMATYDSGWMACRSAMDIVEATNKDAWDVPIEGHELEQGEIAATMDIVKAVNKDHLDGEVEWQGLEGGDQIAATMDALGGPVEGEELDEGETVATMDIVKTMSNDAFDGVVEGQELEEGVTRYGDGETATRYGQEPENGEIAAKGRGQEPVYGETFAKSDHIVQESQFAVDFIPRDCSDSIMRSKMRLAARKPVYPHVKANQTKSHHIVQESQFAVDGIPHDSTDGIMSSKIRLTARKKVRPPVNANHMSLLTTPDGPFSTIRESFATMKKFKAIQSKHVPVNTASTSALANKEKRTFKHLFVGKEKAKDKKASYLKGDDILKAVAVHEGKLVLYVNVPSGVGFAWRHRQHVGYNGDARSKVRMMSRRFQFLCRFIALSVEQRLLEVPRVDLAADKVIKRFPDHTKHESIVGKVAGVEVGDKFVFRAELAIVGLHRPYRAGIDACKDNNGVLIALSVVASGGYVDELSSSGELIYTGSGGKAAGTAEQDGDQKLQGGNLALKNCIATKTPVRVIHGFKSRNREDGSHSKGKEISIYIYDGLYIVVGCWQEGIPGSRVFKYRLRRIPGQPELPLHVTKWIRKSALHPDRRPREREAEPGGGSRSTGDGWRGCRSARDGLRLESR